MRMSCNGCRVLRKGCTDDCTIRPCLHWIKSSDAQANATVFLAKFYGRAGLINLINSGPEHLRPGIFRSLLYEACGRIVNPIYGSVGLLWSGKWDQCEAAVDAVLRGSPIMQVLPSSIVPPPHTIPLPKAFDIRHVSKDSSLVGSYRDLHKVRTRNRFKNPIFRPKPQVDSAQYWSTPRRDPVGRGEFNRAPSYDSWLSQKNGESREDECMFSVETVEGSLVNRAKFDPVFRFDNQMEDSKLGLELTLGLGIVCKAAQEKSTINSTETNRCKVELGN